VTSAIGLSRPAVPEQRSPLYPTNDRTCTHEYTGGSHGNWPTFEDVTVLQLLSVRTLGKALLQSLERFRAQRILTGWTSGGDGPLGGSGGGVGGSYAMFTMLSRARTRGLVDSTHT